MSSSFLLPLKEESERTGTGSGEGKASGDHLVGLTLEDGRGVRRSVVLGRCLGNWLSWLGWGTSWVSDSAGAVGDGEDSGAGSDVGLAVVHERGWARAEGGERLDNFSHCDSAVGLQRVEAEAASVVSEALGLVGGTRWAWCAASIVLGLAGLLASGAPSLAAGGSSAGAGAHLEVGCAGSCLSGGEAGGGSLGGGEASNGSDDGEGLHFEFLLKRGSRLVGVGVVIKIS